MQGPGGNPPRRRAGDSGTPGGTGPAREWQQKVWIGPSPRDVNPFDEPDEAPELLELRSENVREKSGDFWQEDSGHTGYISAAGLAQKEKTKKQKKQKKQKSTKISVHFLKVLGVLLGLAGIAAAILFFGVYRVREIRVEGNRRISAADVEKLSGIRRGDSILTIDDAAVGETMMSQARGWGKRNQNYYMLQFRYLERQMPGTVIISVREREPCCWMDLRGVLYVLDKKRSVLWETENREEAPVNLVEVKGLRVKSGSQGGQTLTMESGMQQRIFEDLFLEMKVLGCTEQIREVDLSRADADKDPSLLMETRHGYTVSLGDCRSSDPETNQIHAKLRAMLLVQEELIRLGKEGGTIDVRTPESPYYSPAKSW